MKIVASAFLLLGATMVVATENPRFTDVVYEGSGCPRGSVEVVTDTEGQSISLIFNEFVAAPDRVESIVKNCAVAAKIEVPQGYSVMVRPTSFGVEHSFTGSSFGRLAIDTLFAGRKASVNLTLGRDGFSTVRTGELSWSACGGEIDVRFLTKLNVRKAAARDTARAAITQTQSIDLAWRSCH